MTSSVSPITDRPTAMNGKGREADHPVDSAPLSKKARLGAGGKELPELYKSTGNEMKDRLAFMHMLENLKTQKRSGWIREGVQQPESIADHMYRMAMLCMLIPIQNTERPLDIGRCVQMALVHDLAEAQYVLPTPTLAQNGLWLTLPYRMNSVGDITPVEGVSPEMKHKARFTWAVSQAKLVKDLDRIELVLQAIEYERSQDVRSLAPFFTGSIPHLHHPAVREWATALLEERKALWEARGLGAEEQQGIEGLRVGSKVDAAAANQASTNGSAV
ncbi:hypothetical protein QFC22_005565 [Naganishia vaughanmartiniae]|uniref:Uncharacterized protein n=1 Tax=Naganishia vaughanmartiniae TaxID=1424756 RepID=A0ACC2WU73_9TREE|nr:hypothetical protein QFC22_005565 [Naganishia vaughanmartiniae]